MTLRYIVFLILFQFCSFLLFGQNENRIRISPAVEKLYSKCGNKLKVTADSVSRDTELRFAVEGGTFKTGPGLNELMIFPANHKVVLHVFDGNKLLGSKEYSVQSIPQPSIVVIADNEDIKSKSISREARTIELKAVCDSSFICACPRDNVYRISYRLIYKVKGTPIYESETITAPASLKAKYMKKADSIEVEVNSVKKINYLNEEVEINFIKRDSNFLIL